MLTEAQMCLRVDVQRALARLDPEDRLVVKTTLISGWTLDELSSVMGCSRDHCHWVSKRAVATLRRHLRPYQGKTTASLRQCSRRKNVRRKLR